MGGKVSLELVLDARLRLADAETSYHRARIEYAVALKNVHFEKGSLLDYNGAVLADGESWRGSAADIARKKLVSGQMPEMSYVMAQRDEQAKRPAKGEGPYDLIEMPPLEPQSAAEADASPDVSAPTPFEQPAATAPLDTQPNALSAQDSTGTCRARLRNSTSARARRGSEGRGSAVGEFFLRRRRGSHGCAARHAVPTRESDMRRG